MKPVKSPGNGFPERFGPASVLSRLNAIALAAGTINDAFARVVRERGGRFVALATLPLNDPAASVVELERAMTVLGANAARLLGL